MSCLLITVAGLLLFVTVSARPNSTDEVTPRTFFAGLLTVDQLNTIIATPGVGTFLFFGLFAWAFLFSFLLGYFELLVGLPGFGTSRNLDVGNMATFDSVTLLSKLATLQEMWPLFEVVDGQCRKKFMCELHAVGPHLGTTARKIIDVIDNVGQVNVSRAPQWLRPILEELVESMRAARGLKGCSIYNRCSYNHSLVNRFKPNRAPTVASKSRFKTK